MEGTLGFTLHQEGPTPRVAPIAFDVYAALCRAAPGSI
jgi:hypothetical protein